VNLIFFFGFLLALSVSNLAFAEPVKTVPIWQRGQKLIQTVPCTADRGDGDIHCLALQVSDAESLNIVGDEYARVRILWSKRSKETGPDVLLLADHGGSSGDSDIFAVSFLPRPQVRTLRVAPGDAVSLRSSRQTLCLNLPFEIGGFNDAPYAGTTLVPIPVCWHSGDFTLDRKALLARTFPEEDLVFRNLAVQSELGRWASDIYPATNLYPVKTTGGTPVTALALADLMLAGHADLAQEILHKNWPRSHQDLNVSLKGESRFWTALCRLIVKNEDWRYFHLDRLPNAGLIEAGAKSLDD